jgi:arylsulfatase A-like enzyme
VEQTFGPGEAGYVQQLEAYDKAFGQFFERLAKDGITKDNTLFVVTADENDHFIGGAPSPAGCDGVKTPCTYAEIGEINADLSKVLFTEFSNTTPFTVHSDDAPTFYVTNDQNGQTDTPTRTLEQNAAALLGFDKVAVPTTNAVTQALADRAEQDLLHMITKDPARTPNFILFANPDYFLSASGSLTACTPASNAASCFVEQSGFAWNHGDFQTDITTTWLGIVGPGVLHQGEFGSVFSDHTDIRPTILSLVGLEDDYAHDGRVLFEALTDRATPRALRAHQDALSALADAYKRINAPLGELGFLTLTGISTKALSSTDPGIYNSLEAQINSITATRNDIAGQMIKMLEDAAFNNRPINEAVAASLIKRANDLLDLVTP